MEDITRYVLRLQYITLTPRSIRLDLFLKKGVLKNFTKFAGKHLCRNLFFNNVTGLRPVTLLKLRLQNISF